MIPFCRFIPFSFPLRACLLPVLSIFSLRPYKQRHPGKLFPGSLSIKIISHSLKNCYHFFFYISMAFSMFFEILFFPFLPDIRNHNILRLRFCFSRNNIFNLRSLAVCQTFRYHTDISAFSGNTNHCVFKPFRL